MKLLPIAAFAILLSTSAAVAGAGAPVPEGSQNPPPSGRPSDSMMQRVRKCGKWRHQAAIRLRRTRPCRSL
jgi:hypothetical protein